MRYLRRHCEERGDEAIQATAVIALQVVFLPVEMGIPQCGWYKNNRAPMKGALAGIQQLQHGHLLIARASARLRMQDGKTRAMKSAAMLHDMAWRTESRIKACHVKSER